MDVYLVSYSSNRPSRLVKEIAHMVDGAGGIRVHTHIPVHSSDRTCAEDYDSKVAFTHHPTTGKVFKLGPEPVYIDDQYTAVYFSYPHDFYAVFHKDLTHSAWNVVKHLLPTPEAVYNPSVSHIPRGRSRRPPANALWVNTAAKPALFDNEDVFVPAA
ncbi:hypothetical protein RRG08_010268 [Elysia crispata]|uniref:Uncharacterized protein n=1 Tax=Elysia crispata TaxID=231223 RepID=A0AAE0Z2C3_9GAST|nr:hypothetical protein RRG08_010268 [Elysia crispata]